MNKLWWVSAEAFQSLERTDRHRMLQLMHPARYEANKVVYSSSLPGDVVYLLQQGRITLYQTTPTKTRRKLVSLQRGDIFGSVSMINSGFKYGLAQTETETRMLVLRKAPLEQLMKYFPSTGARLVEFFEAQQESLMQAENQRNARNTCRRLSRLLLHYLDHPAYQLNGQYPAFVADAKELALQLGSRPEVIQLCLADLEKQGLIACREQYLELRDRAGLEARLI